MPRKKLIACALIWPLASVGCTSIPPQTKIQPVAVQCPVVPTPPAWMMESSAPNYTQRLLKVLSISPATPISVQPD
jgi:hypothetical protein